MVIWLRRIKPANPPTNVNSIAGDADAGAQNPLCGDPNPIAIHRHNRGYRHARIERLSRPELSVCLSIGRRGSARLHVSSDPYVPA